MTTKLFEKNRGGVGGGGFLVLVVYSWHWILRQQGDKYHKCLRSTLSRWRHLATISFLLLSAVLGSARDMCIFSIRQRWQILTSCCTMAQGWGWTSVDCMWSAHPSATYMHNLCEHRYKHNIYMYLRKTMKVGIFKKELMFSVPAVELFHENILLRSLMLERGERFGLYYK